MRRWQYTVKVTNNYPNTISYDVYGYIYNEQNKIIDFFSPPLKTTTIGANKSVTFKGYWNVDASVEKLKQNDNIWVWQNAISAD